MRFLAFAIVCIGGLTVLADEARFVNSTGQNIEMGVGYDTLSQNAAVVVIDSEGDSEGDSYPVNEKGEIFITLNQRLHKLGAGSYVIRQSKNGLIIVPQSDDVVTFAAAMQANAMCLRKYKDEASQHRCTVEVATESVIGAFPLTKRIAYRICLEDKKIFAHTDLTAEEYDAIVTDCRAVANSAN